MLWTTDYSKSWPLQPLTRYLASRTFLRIFGSLLVGFEKSITMFFCCEDFKDYYWLNYDQKRTRIDWDMTTFRYDGIGLVQDRVALILYDVELTGKKRDKKSWKVLNSTLTILCLFLYQTDLNKTFCGGMISSCRKRTAKTLWNATICLPLLLLSAFLY